MKYPAKRWGPAGKKGCCARWGQINIFRIKRGLSKEVGEAVPRAVKLPLHPGTGTPGQIAG